MRRSRPLLGTFVEVEASGLAEPALERSVTRAFDAIERVHRLMSFHDPESDISRLNRHAAFSPVTVDPWTAKVLHKARVLFEATDGLFDCAVGYEAMQRGLLPSQDLHHVGRGTFSAVEFLADNRVRFSAQIALDLGGIAKGFAVDRAIAVLRAQGVGEALHNAAIATSSATATQRKGNVQRLGPPASATSSAEESAYSVVAPTCLLADALTKVLVQVGNSGTSYFAQFGATAFVTSGDVIEGRAA